MKAVLTLSAAVALSGCTVSAAGLATSHAAATIPFAGVATVGPVRIRPLAIVEDSRCPLLVRCVWAGRLRLLAGISVRRGPELQRELELGTPVALAEGRLMLSAAAPDKAASEAIPPAAYRFTFTFARP